VEEPLITPFRQRYDRARRLDLRSQLEECVDYLQNPQVLISEFLESYYLVEAKLDPEREDRDLEAHSEEVVLEPYFDALELRVRDGSETQCIRCLAGAFAPLAGELHPALEQRGVDYVAVREGTQRLVLGVSDALGDATAFSLLLRGLNCLAELSPPFQIARLSRHVLRERIEPDECFDLQLGLGSRDEDEDVTALVVLTRDLAEVFKRAMQAEEQFAGSVGRIDCLTLGSPTPDADTPLEVRWTA